jgi:dTDP-4-amino-4,6-dideoxygalactose transaminase
VNTWKVPFTNLKSQYASVQAEVNTAINKTLSDFNLLWGEEVIEFEKQFARLINTSHCISTASGTDSLFAILKCMALQPGDEVLTPALSWISSAETISLAGGKPVFVDIDPVFYTIDPAAIERQITERTKGIVVVHLYGQAADMDGITSICAKYNLFLIEDCAQAHLTRYADRYVGTFGKGAAFSFYPTKNLGAYGDAGAVTTSDPVLAEKVRRFCNHGALNKYDHIFEGMNSRMDTLQAAILLAKLPHLHHWTQRRIANAEFYRQHLKAIPEVILPEVRSKSTHTYHIFAIRVTRRDELREYLRANGIQTVIHYPQILINVPAYAHFHLRKEDYPTAIALESQILSLPVYPELQQDQIFYVSEKIRAFYIN